MIEKIRMVQQILFSRQANASRVSQINRQTKTTCSPAKYAKVQSTTNTTVEKSINLFPNSLRTGSAKDVESSPKLISTRELKKCKNCNANSALSKEVSLSE